MQNIFIKKLSEFGLIVTAEMDSGVKMQPYTWKPTEAVAFSSLGPMVILAMNVDVSSCIYVW